MNLIDALKSGRPFRRTSRSWWVSNKTREEAVSCCHELDEWFTEERYFRDVLIGKADIVADDWVIQPEPEKSALVTRTQFWEAIEFTAREFVTPNAAFFSSVARKLGLES